eukprot:1991722-Prymnesium_polylepis.1
MVCERRKAGHVVAKDTEMSGRMVRRARRSGKPFVAGRAHQLCAQRRQIHVWDHACNTRPLCGLSCSQSCAARQHAINAPRDVRGTRAARTRNAPWAALTEEREIDTAWAS